MDVLRAHVEGVCRGDVERPRLDGVQRQVLAADLLGRTTERDPDALLDHLGYRARSWPLPPPAPFLLTGGDCLHAPAPPSRRRLYLYAAAGFVALARLCQPFTSADVWLLAGALAVPANLAGAPVPAWFTRAFVKRRAA